MRVISYDTYKQFAKQYKIRLSKVVNGKRIKKPMSELQHEIYNYEKNNNINKGLYFNVSH